MSDSSSSSRLAALAAFYKYILVFSPPFFSPLPPPVDYAGRGPDVLYAVQTEDMSQVREQHQRRRLQLQLLPTQNRALRWYAWLLIVASFIFFFSPQPFFFFSFWMELVLWN